MSVKIAICVRITVGRAKKLLRGGSWNNNPVNCRSARRNNNTRDNRNNNVGFRVSCVMPSTLHRQNWLV
jgi:formylglycine-generating enzyme required for sulfatase activity